MEAASEKILGYTVVSSGLGSCLETIENLLDSQRTALPCCQLALCLNPHSYVESLHNPLFSDTLHHADWLVPDGAGIVLASRVLGGKIHERISGSDLFCGINKLLEKKGNTKVFFLGSTEETLKIIVRKLSEEYPGIQLAGTFSPPFKSEFSEQESNAMVEAINNAHPDVLWVGMTSPKQDIWLYENRERLNVLFAAAIGAVFDFYTGKAKRSHPFFQKIGLEWLPRLLRDPKRLWKRTVISAPVFLFHLFRHKIFTTFHQSPPFS